MVRLKGRADAALSPDEICSSMSWSTAPLGWRLWLSSAPPPIWSPPAAHRSISKLRDTAGLAGCGSLGALCLCKVGCQSLRWPVDRGGGRRAVPNIWPLGRVFTQPRPTRVRRVWSTQWAESGHLFALSAAGFCYECRHSSGPQKGTLKKGFSVGSVGRPDAIQQNGATRHHA